MDFQESLREVTRLRLRFQMNNRLRLECLAALSKVFREYGEPVSDELLSSVVLALPDELHGNGALAEDGAYQSVLPRGVPPTAVPPPGVPPPGKKPGVPPPGKKPGVPPPGKQPSVPPTGVPPTAVPPPGVPPPGKKPGVPPPGKKPGVPPPGAPPKRKKTR